ncbi:MAG: 1-acyl-sn-glycerol-3-phosphate acyltransferase [Saprospiraceae bacterium]|nr:1-acyl-sn-glycerol-3-phosphate acyltransferase [Saprospiraceae bacterium]
MSNKLYPHIIPEIEKWPIYQFGKQRSLYVEELRAYTNEILLERYGDRLKHVLRRTAYQERARIKNRPWKADPPSEAAFWKKVQSSVPDIPDEPMPNEQAIELLDRIVHRYSEEIVGNFKTGTFYFARKFLTAFFGRMLNAAKGRIFGSRRRLYEKLIVEGEIEKVRHLFKKGVVVALPTHFSNLDSIMIGYAFDVIMGLPAFTYGAGLNLYDSEIFGYFMNRLGAYRVDRRKKNPIYIETLKSMSSLSLQKGVNGLFFPGGTRSRSGAIEEELKQGLLNSLVEAQRTIYERNDDLKVIVVPIVINYHVVLEADHLITQHLNILGKDSFVRVKDDFQSYSKILRFLWRFFSQQSEIYLSVAQPMDVMGNTLDDDCRSIDHQGNVVDLKAYFKTNNVVTPNEQREKVYTRQLAEAVVKSYQRYNIVLSSHMVAFAAFNYLRKCHEDDDIFSLIKLPEDDFIFNRERMLEIIRQLRKAIEELKQEGQIRSSFGTERTDVEVLQAGLDNLGVYHALKPLKVNQDKKIVSESFKTLFYYHNRLTGYELEHAIDWRAVFSKGNH